MCALAREELGGLLRWVDLREVLRLLATLGRTGHLVIAKGVWSGSLLLDQGCVVGSHFGSERGLSALEAIVLTLLDGEFSFAPAPPPEECNLTLGEEELFDVLARLIAERDALSAVIPSPAAVARVTDRYGRGEQVVLDDSAIHTLLAIDGRRRVEQIADGRGLAQTMRELARFAEAGLVCIDSPPAKAEPAVRAAGLGHALRGFFLKD
jgi:hypothetical protein